MERGTREWDQDRLLQVAAWEVRQRLSEAGNGLVIFTEIPGAGKWSGLETPGALLAAVRIELQPIDLTLKAEQFRDRYLVPSSHVIANIIGMGQFGRTHLRLVFGSEIRMEVNTEYLPA